MKAEGQLSSPGVRLPGVLALSLPLDQVNGALCECYLSARWDQTTTQLITLLWG